MKRNCQTESGGEFLKFYNHSLMYQLIEPDVSKKTGGGKRPVPKRKKGEGNRTIFPTLYVIVRAIHLHPQYETTAKKIPIYIYFFSF